MTSHWQDWPPQVLAALRKGVVIPAHPLALTADRKLDSRRQRALTSYYLDAGAGGLAVGVHTTQFTMREAGLFEPVLELAMRSAAEWALDLVTPFTVVANGRERTVRIKGGLLGHWSVWVKRAVELLQRIHAAAAENEVSAELLALDAQVTDCNAAIFDAANDFHGVTAGCHEILRRQGLLEGIWCLDPSETLGSGQKQEIDRVCAAYPHLNDDAFVRANLQRWLA